MKERESVKLREGTENVKPIPMGHQQMPLQLFALFAPDSSELELTYSAVKELTNTHKPVQEITIFFSLVRN